MGYACPVCEDPQADAGHLANHLAFTAILGDDVHEAWLDEHVPGWAEMDEAELGARLAGAVPETEFPQVFEDTAGGLAASDDPPAERSGALFDEAEDGHDHAGGLGGGEEPHPNAPVDQPFGSMDAETRAVLEEAREMTRAMLGADAEEGATDVATDEGTTDEETADGADTEDDGTAGDGSANENG